LTEKLNIYSESAFRELVFNYKDYIFRICYSILNHREDAEDITQEVFIEVYKSAQSFKGDSKISTWLYRIAVNKSINYLQSKERNTWLKKIKPIFNKEHKARPLEDNPANRIDHMMEMADKNSIIQTAINRLPEKQRIAFILNKIDGLSYQQVAEIMKISLSATETLIHRAKIRLQTELKEIYRK
jgi:RNA polymerase sigma-70 factor (ECF subfamily)